jgi:hypothetical protein
VPKGNCSFLASTETSDTSDSALILDPPCNEHPNTFVQAQTLTFNV